ncbi:MAG: hypothetical protein AB1324_04560 [Candidatus Micrarchaeota archaeon]
MLPKMKEAPETGKKRPDEPFDKLMLKLDLGTFTRVQSSEWVRLRVICNDLPSFVTFSLKNMSSGTEGYTTTLDLRLDVETYKNILNPRLKVIFQHENVIAPFVATAMAGGNFFSAGGPIVERPAS